jgi:hypothetical protein
MRNGGRRYSVVAAACATQTVDLRDGTANTEAIVFDGKGGRHSRVNGYYGPPVPYFADPDLDNTWNSSIVGTCQIK